MTCKMCLERGKDWSGSDPTCAFKSETFSSDGWNCATANAIRDICEDNTQFCDDTNYSSIKISDVASFEETGGPPWIGLCLWVTWYKRRGRTEEMWVLGNGTPRLPTEAECLRIIEHYH